MSIKGRVMCETKIALLKLIYRFGPNAISNIFIELRKVNQMWMKQIKTIHGLRYFNDRNKNSIALERERVVDTILKNTFHSNGSDLKKIKSVRHYFELKFCFKWFPGFFFIFFSIKVGIRLSITLVYF